jgi:hypothetical protein
LANEPVEKPILRNVSCLKKDEFQKRYNFQG